jgi:hypothetical protein
LVFEPETSGGVGLWPFAGIVNVAIHLDSQSGRSAVEIEDVSAGGMLAAELEAFGALPQFLPEQHFGERHGLAQGRRLALGGFRSVDHGCYPSTMLRMVPLPFQGRIFA